MKKINPLFPAVLSLWMAVLCLALTIAFITPPTAHADPGVLYVKPASSGAGDCSSWPDACGLQTALAAATTGDQIWVAAGVHTPGTNRTHTFTLKNGVEMYGGFAGTETTRNQRDWLTHVTVLSGDIDNNDLTDANGVITDTANIQGNNAYNVIISTGVYSTTVLDGFVVTGGYGSSIGGGMYNNSNSNPTLANILFSGNSALNYGGGMYNQSSNPTLTKVTFSGNSASYGGGMSNLTTSNATLRNVTFNNNSADIRGGGMFNSNSSPSLTHVTFHNNSALLGGAVTNSSQSNPSLDSATFTANSASSGGAVHNQYSNPTLTNVVFYDNSATSNGGGMYNDYSHPLLSNVTFHDNSAHNGGGISNQNSNPTLVNGILWGDSASNGAEIINHGDSTPSVSYSLVQGGYAGVGNIHADPRFLNPSAGDLHLDLDSPAIDSGNNEAVPVGISTDLDGAPRFVDIASVPDTGNGTPPIVDRGAYEASIVLYAAPASQGDGNCRSWMNACTLQTALATVGSGYQVWVQQGIHKPTDTSDSSISFVLQPGVALYGGFDGTESLLSQRNWFTNVTVLSGDIDNNDLTDPFGVVTNTANILGENSFSVVVSKGVTETAVLDGFIITAGQANETDPYDRGGGMQNLESNPTVVNVILRGNLATLGGGMHNWSSNPALTNVVFHGNSASDNGGGMYNESSKPALTNATFNRNIADQLGGGMYNDDSSLRLENSILWGDQAADGAEIFNTNHSIPLIAYSNIEGCGGSKAWDDSCGQDKSGNIDEDPLFVDSTSGNLRMSPGSPVIDAANNRAVPSDIASDLDGNPRFVDIDSVPDTGNGDPPIVDMGAYEAQINRPPVFTSTPVITATVTVLYTYAITTDDPDLLFGDVLAIDAPTLPDWLTLTYHQDGTATLTGTPGDPDAGNHPVQLRVSDKGEAYTLQEFEISVLSRIYLPLVIKNSP